MFCVALKDTGLGLICKDLLDYLFGVVYAQIYRIYIMLKKIMYIIDNDKIFISQ